ncbi:ZIP family metal transporter [Bergeyella sp. RCAD1439]|uniref:ZIP family metal transporter n=1 Tax=Bergeyella anatis TaxID=3113737 RepID=UPI002E17DE8A|nr:ZIP family metal transporter [Bergeyella sp. RCAD1439]
MSEILQTIMLYTLIPIVTFVGGGILAAYRKPSPAFRSVILHFSAGVIFSVVAVELLPDIVEKHRPFYVVVGFLAGIFLMLMIKKFADKAENKQKSSELIPKIPIAFVVAIGVDIFIDGLLLGIGFASGAKAGMLLAFAIALEMFSMGMAVASELTAEGISKGKSVRHIVLLSSLFMVSAVLGGTLLQNLGDRWMELVLSFGLSALLYLVTEELLVKAHEEEDKPWYTFTFFLGFLVFLVLGMVV